MTNPIDTTVSLPLQAADRIRGLFAGALEGYTPTEREMREAIRVLDRATNCARGIPVPTSHDAEDEFNDCA